MTVLRIAAIVAAGFALAGCGADGEPVQPTASLGVGVGSSGTHVGGGVGFRSGGLGIYIGV
ncbi:argininosuccinate lyase [Ruegeria sp. R13_0]|uniref:argininosuccinate lyase n=1 Tax=Ruegeria sp. R13_0 TaxID=2821099 RepID=UPI001ADC2002|nr:argininosuccinate lyase [Ruegeria sp. R13_0]MBO9434200.1 argininosuccinate lyase [Ruegeria sp. R13_0]